MNGCTGKQLERQVRRQIGRHFKHWTILSSEERDKDNWPLWLCRCRCGAEQILNDKALRKGSWPCCKCGQGQLKEQPEKQLEKQKQPQEIGFSSLFAHLRRTAWTWNRLWKLSGQEALLFSLTQQNCFYCDTEPAMFRGWLHNRLDLHDLHRGYVPDNIVPCCRDCYKSKRQRLT